MKKILLVDDDSDISKIYSMEFTKGGYEVHAASDGAEALEMIKNQEWDLVLLDVQLPKLSGIDVLKTLKKEGNGILTKTPFFLLTNLGKDEVMEEAKDLGVRGMFVKALYKPSVLVEMINTYFAKNDPE